MLSKLLVNPFLKGITQLGHEVIIHLIHVHPSVDHPLAALLDLPSVVIVAVLAYSMFYTGSLCFKLFSLLLSFRHSRLLDFGLGVSLISCCIVKYTGESLHMTLSEIHPISSVYFYGVGNVTWNNRI